MFHHPPTPTSLNPPASQAQARYLGASPPDSGRASASGPSRSGTLSVPASAQVSSTPALLIPTDRSQEELEERWLGRLGRLVVERELELPGYALYSLRTWFLSRDHFSETIVTQTGKHTDQITVYRLIPHPSLSRSDGELEVATAVQQLASATKSSARRTEWGTLLITTPGAYGQDVFVVPGGDLREARPFLVINTGLRRLGCGGRAAMAIEAPIPALRRKFLDLYRLPPPPAPAPLSRQASPQVSPSRSTTLHPDRSSPGRHDGLHAVSYTQHAHPILGDPFSLMVMECVRLIQASLALWGLFGRREHGEVDLDGLFCDETKKGIGAWRKAMGMEHQESLKLEKETSGGCIDPKTLAVLLSSITSTYYQLTALGQDRLPKDPFRRLPKFLDAWRTYQLTSGHAHHVSEFLSVSSIRSLTSDFHAQRARSPSDALKVHRLLFSATSSLSANLKGGSIDDTPLRKREHHIRLSPNTDGVDPGLSLIMPDEDVLPVASPNTITTNLDAYIQGILKTKEKDWDVIGARRIGGLWSGHALDMDKLEGKGKKVREVNNGHGHSHGHGLVGARRRKSLDASINGFGGHTEEGESDTGVSGRGVGGVVGVVPDVVRKTGNVIKGGFGLVSRRGTTYETSDSEGGPGPSALKNSLARRKQSVPLVIEPDLEEVEEMLRGPVSISPSPSVSGRHIEVPHPTFSTRNSFTSGGSRSHSKRPSIVTNLSNNGSDRSLLLHRQSSADRDRDRERSISIDPRSVLEDKWEYDQRDYNHHSNTATTPGSAGGYHFPPRRSDHRNGDPYGSGYKYGHQYSASDAPAWHSRRSVSERAIAWREAGRQTAMLRTASDGADVTVEEGGNEWEVVNPHGTGRGQHGEDLEEARGELRRSLSLEDMSQYRGMRVIDLDKLVVDVKLCEVISELRKRERELAKKAEDLKVLEDSIFTASQSIIDAVRTRRHATATLSKEADDLTRGLESLPDEVDADVRITSAAAQVEFARSGALVDEDLAWKLTELRTAWVEARKGNEERRREIVGLEQGREGRGGWGSSWWPFG